MILPESLYHATNIERVDSILQYGLQTKYYGAIHGEMEIHPPVSVIYLSRNETSNNLHVELFNSEVVVLKISTEGLDLDSFYPDDFIYNMFANEEIIKTARQVEKALMVSPLEAKKIFKELINATDEDLPNLLKPFWSYYLAHPLGGEVAYTQDIPAKNILEITPLENLKLKM